MSGAISIWISALSLFVAIVAIILNWKNSKRIVEIEEARENDRLISKKKAQLQAYIETRGKCDRLVIANKGYCEARNIIIKMDGKSFKEHCAAVNGDETIQIIGAGAEVTMPIVFTLECYPPFDLEINWDDDSGEKGYYRTTLTP